MPKCLRIYVFVWLASSLFVVRGGCNRRFVNKSPFRARISNDGSITMKHTHTYVVHAFLFLQNFPLRHHQLRFSPFGVLVYKLLLRHGENKLHLAHNDGRMNDIFDSLYICIFRVCVYLCVSEHINIIFCLHSTRR